MKKELEYFTIDGEFGGNQDWFTNVVMHVGGCAAATACDSCIYFARKFGMKSLYPFDTWKLNKEEYKKYSQIMKPYLRPRINGVNKLYLYTDGFHEYLKDKQEDGGVCVSAEMKEFSGEHTVTEAKQFVRQQIGKEIPIPYLMLRHKNKEKFEDFIWHWFLVIGYEEKEDGFWIRVATYGEGTWLNLEELWNTGEKEKGGMIGYRLENV